ncbi:hypothetical protein PI125_g22182 [Phytophthora idaei]|nr:hypothetical protein PI125_g22182 [Phytophthora idaei]
MVRVPVSSGDSGFHRETQEEEEVPIKVESRMDASSEAGSLATLPNNAGSAYRLGGTAGHDPHRNPPDGEPKASQHSRDASATSMAGSDSSEGSQRMQLGPSRATMLRSRSHRTSHEEATSDSQEAVGPDRRQTFFNAAMDRFLEEQRAIEGTTITSTGPSVRDARCRHEIRRLASWGARPRRSRPRDSSPRSGGHSRYGSQWTGDRSAIRVSAILELKSALVFGGLFTGPARNWYRLLSRTTRSDWKEFQVQICGLGVSVARQYYHARNRADESPLEYLHRLNVAGLRAKLRVKSGPLDVHREHVEHFIGTLDDRDLADQLALLRIPDADTVEEDFVPASGQRPDKD